MCLKSKIGQENFSFNFVCDSVRYVNTVRKVLKSKFDRNKLAITIRFIVHFIILDWMGGVVLNPKNRGLVGDSDENFTNKVAGCCFSSRVRKKTYHIFYSCRERAFSC